jgi:glycosyltransferase involved in cell wall biosynthesis
MTEGVATLNDQLRIAMITTWNTRCGIAEYSRSLTEALTRLGHGTDILASYPVRPVPENNDRPEVQRWFYTGWHQERGVDLAKALQVLQKRESQIIHLQYQNFIYAPPFLSALHSLAQVAPLVVTFHDPLLPPGFPHADCKAGIFHTDKTAALIGWNKRKKVIPIGIYNWPDENREAARQRLHISSRHVLCSLGLGRTDHGSVLQAMQGLHDRYPDLLYVIIAPPDLHNSTYKRAVDLGLGENIRYLNHFPPNEEIVNYLHAADLTVFYYGEFGIPGVCSAASRLGIAGRRPVILSDVKLMQDLPDPLKIPYGSIPALQARIMELFENPGAVSAALQIQEQLISQYDWDLTAAAHVQLYREVLGS